MLSKVGKKFLEVVGKPANGVKIIFIPTAATTELIIGNKKEIIE